MGRLEPVESMRTWMTHHRWPRMRASIGAGHGSDELRMLIYLDPRALTRDCVGRWLQSQLSGFSVCLLPDPEQITGAPIVSDQPGGRHQYGGRADVIARRDPPVVAGERAAPTVPVAVMSDYEDSENIQAAFELGVHGYIPTSLGVAGGGSGGAPGLCRRYLRAGGRLAVAFGGRQRSGGRR